jgi:transitional endoplasmic reticulum ATPase
MSAAPDHSQPKGKVKLDNDPSGKEQRDENEVATAILKKKKKPNSLIVTDATTDDNSILALSNNTME